MYAFSPRHSAGRADSRHNRPCTHMADAQAPNPRSRARLLPTTAKRIDAYIAPVIRSRIAKYVWMIATITNTMPTHR
jgi:hypothetical protein